ncbi:hypothetical protein JP75_16825 [Devosia riboflavina]|uniref:Phosphoribulokinase/uridine kinase domain-containing protein n=1 Tax=Devosia riboflavina TaxID=46914 RepID=A0A087M037_9HYPH|nr:hypothetical protein [Devosia riboflavina]KFL30240.1 hypothetical protein JP75_16825 [Devosia riboflavina]
MMTADETVAFLRKRPDIRLIGIDGLPVSGKSTLAESLIDALGAKVIYFDDFILPKKDWPEPTEPGFPFLYVRYEEFFHAVEALATSGTCSYRLYDWASGTLGGTRTVEAAGGLVIVEGVSALSPRISALYDLRIWVESDAKTTLAAALARGVGPGSGNGESFSCPALSAISKRNRKNARILSLPGAAPRASHALAI